MVEKGIKARRRTKVMRSCGGGGRAGQGGGREGGGRRRRGEPSGEGVGGGERAPPSTARSRTLLQLARPPRGPGPGSAKRRLQIAITAAAGPRVAERAGGARHDGRGEDRGALSAGGWPEGPAAPPGRGRGFCAEHGAGGRAPSAALARRSTPTRLPPPLPRGGSCLAPAAAVLALRVLSAWHWLRLA